MNNNRIKVKDLLSKAKAGDKAIVMGWVKTFRNNQFIALNDGSTLQNLQVLVELGSITEEVLKKINTGTSIKATGEIVESVGKGQSIELRTTTLEILGECDGEKYPLQPKKHSLEFLREIAHLRFRTNTFNAVFKIRSGIAFAIHKFFNEKGFVYIHTPVITSSDAEGAGEMFRVTTLPLLNLPKDESGNIDFKEDFFGKSTNLTVSGQLEGELAAMAFSEIYTFGPTFRAENSNTTRHLAEFWMIEPEMAFYDLEDNMELAEKFIRYIVAYILTNFPEEIDFLNSRLEEEEKTKPSNEREGLSLIEKLNGIVNNPFERITYTEAINILLQSNHYKKKKFKYEIGWGTDLQSEHERYLVEKHFGKPTIVTNYPASIKAFYMRLDDGCDPERQTVSAMDILAPGIGEIVGGSQREERYLKLTDRMEKMHIPKEELDWYLDTRRFGSVIHSGFGLGFERIVQFITGMSNIRDVVPFARTPNNCEF